MKCNKLTLLKRKTTSKFLRIVAIIHALAFGLLVQNGQAQTTYSLPFYDPWPAGYTNGVTSSITINGITAIGSRLADVSAAAVNPSSVWSLPTGSTGGNGSITNHIGALLTYAGLATTNGANLGAYFSGATTGGRSRAVPLTSPPTSGKIYASFLVKILTPPAAGQVRAIGGFNSSATATSGTTIAGVFVNESGALQVSKNSGTVPGAGVTSPLSAGTHLLVLRYEWLDGSANDEVVLWVDPPFGSFGADESSVPDGTLTNAAGNDFAQVGSFQLCQYSSGAGSPNGSELLLDEVRLATTWADVTPGTVCNSANITTPPASKSAFAGSTANFTRVATGTGVTNQWQVNPGGVGSWTDIPGATGPNYTTPALTLGDNNNQYRVVVGASCDTITVTSTPPAVLSVIDGSTVIFRTVNNGDWNSLSTWEQSANGGASFSSAIAPPSAANSFITNRHMVAVTNNLAIDQTIVQSGATIVVSNGTLTVVDGTGTDCSVSGTLQVNGGSVALDVNASLTVNSGGSFIWNANAAPNIPTATWADGSTCAINNILSSGNSVAVGIAGQNFYDFTINYPNLGTGRRLFMGINSDTTIRRNFAITIPDLASASVAIATNGNITVGGDVTFVTGTTANSTKVLLSATATSTPVFKLGGNFSASGYLDGFGGADNTLEFTKAGSQTLTLPTGSGLITGSAINYQVNSGSTLSLGSGVGTVKVFTVKSGGSLSFGANQMTGAGILTVEAGGTVVGNGTNILATGLTTFNFGGTLNINQSLPAFVGGESFQIFNAGAYNVTGLTLIPTIPGAGLTWDATAFGTSGTLAVVGGGGGNQPLVITSTTLVAGTLTLQGGVGTNNGPFTVKSNANVAAPLGSWGVWQTGNFDGSGNFSVSGTVPTGQRFFIIQQP